MSGSHVIKHPFLESESLKPARNPLRYWYSRIYGGLTQSRNFVKSLGGMHLEFQPLAKRAAHVHPLELGWTWLTARIKISKFVPAVRTLSERHLPT